MNFARSDDWILIQSTYLRKVRFDSSLDKFLRVHELFLLDLAIFTPELG